MILSAMRGWESRQSPEPVFEQSFSFSLAPAILISTMFVGWRLKRQLLFFGFFAVIILLVAGYGAYRLIPVASCTDGRINQGEAQVDCGGPCGPCMAANAKEPLVIWARYFEIRPGVFDVAALIENANVSLGVATVPYTFRLLDAEGGLIVNRRGSAYILPNQQTLVFETGLVAGIRAPARVTFALDPFEWRVSEEQKLSLTVVKTERAFEAERPKLTITLQNASIHDVPRVDVSVLLSDANGNAIAAGLTRIDNVSDLARADAVFTWPQPFARSVADVRVFIRTNPWERL